MSSHKLFIGLRFTMKAKCSIFKYRNKCLYAQHKCYILNAQQTVVILTYLLLLSTLQIKGYFSQK